MCVSLFFSEDYRPRSIRPWSSIRTGVEGEFDARVSSREHYQSRPMSSRVMPDIRKESLKTAPPEDKFVEATTYKNLMLKEEICLSPRKRAPRYNREFKLPDQLDWL